MIIAIGQTVPVLLPTFDPTACESCLLPAPSYWPGNVSNGRKTGMEALKLEPLEIFMEIFGTHLQVFHTS